MLGGGGAGGGGESENKSLEFLRKKNPVVSNLTEIGDLVFCGYGQ